MTKIPVCQLTAKTLIASSTSQVARGVKLVGETGQALGGIFSKVTQIDAVISEIAQSSHEQAKGLNQVNAAVNQMDQVTQQNAAMVEQATAAASNLKSEAGELARLVSRFQTGAAVPQKARPQLVQADRIAPAVKAAANIGGRVAAFPRPGGGSQAVAQAWEEF